VLFFTTTVMFITIVVYYKPSGFDNLLILTKTAVKR